MMNSKLNDKAQWTQEMIDDLFKMHGMNHVQALEKALIDEITNSILERNVAENKRRQREKKLKRIFKEND